LAIFTGTLPMVAVPLSSLSFFAERGDACMFWRADEASPSTRFAGFFATPGILDTAGLAGGCMRKKKERKGVGVVL
jgi:hypothetical protein